MDQLPRDQQSQRLEVKIIASFIFCLKNANHLFSFHHKVYFIRYKGQEQGAGAGGLGGGLGSGLGGGAQAVGLSGLGGGFGGSSFSSGSSFGSGGNRGLSTAYGAP